MQTRSALLSIAALAATTFALNAGAAPIGILTGVADMPSAIVKAAYDARVRDVQAELNSKGYNAGPVDGYMGSRTRAAISAYQRSNNLLVTGEASFSLLSHIRGNSANVGAEAEDDDDSRQTRVIARTQSRLATLGYDVAATGTVDARTRNAIWAYQRDNNLVLTGQLDRDLVRAIREDRREARQTDGQNGLSAAQVLELERGLQSRGYDVGDVDGRVDSSTTAAIRAFQSDSGISVDGEVNAKLAERLSVGVAKSLNTPENIRAVQQALNSKGYNAGPADGVMGPSTRNAISSFGRSNGLGSSVDITEPLLTKLDLSTGAAAGTTTPVVGYTLAMSDNFSDRDYIDNPIWAVHSGEFSAASGYLSTRAPATTAGSAAQAGIAGMLGQVLGVPVSGPATVAAIAQGANFANAFKIETTLLGAGNENVAMHFGPYFGDDLASGYRLYFNQTQNNSLSLLVQSGGRSVTLARKEGVTELGDGRRRAVVWTRDKSGQMLVQIDGSTVLDAKDTSHQGEFNGYSFVATQGAWNVHSVSTASVN